MKEFKEKPKAGKVKEKPKPAVLPRQAARMMKEKYIKQLKQQSDQQSKGAEDSAPQAADQVEQAGLWAADELAGWTMEQGRKYAKKRFVVSRLTSQPDLEPASHGEDAPFIENISGNQSIPETSSSMFKECPVVEHSSIAPKERLGPERPTTPTKYPAARRPPTAFKERPQMEHTADPIKDIRMMEHRTPAQEYYSPTASRRTPPHSGGYPLADRTTTTAQKTVLRGGIEDAPKTTIPSIHPESTRFVNKPERAVHERPRLDIRYRRGTTPSAFTADSGFGGKAPQPSKTPFSPKVRREAAKPTVKFTTKSTVKTSAKSITKATAQSAGPAVQAAKATQQKIKRQMFTQTKQTAKNAAGILKRATQAVANAAAAATGAVSAIVGGCVLLVALVVIIVIAAVANSPFGLFFAQEPTAPNAVSVSQAVGSVNMAYNTELEQLQAGDYDSIDIQGTTPDWPDVLAVFAVKVAGADVGGMDVATLDADRVAKLTDVFWDMTTLTSTVETISHPDSDPDDGIDDSWTERILHITITPKTADDMRTVYGFTDYQNSALDELLADRAALSDLAGSLTITSADMLEILRALPNDLSPERRAVVEKVLSLVGKVNYFWGGKSNAIGWDSRWGTLQLVMAPGSSTSGTYRPFGLDCSGFMDWALRNAGLHSDGHWYIGRNLTAVSLADAMPGDFALYPDASHVGMIVGRNAAGKLLVCHCSYGMNNVVVTEFTASGFTAVGRQPFVPG